MYNIMNNIINAFGGLQNFANTVNQTDQALRDRGISAEGKVQEMVNTGKANQSQLQLAMKIADFMTGRNR